MATDPLDLLPDGPRTDLSILRREGGVIEEHGDHLVVRTPHNPDYHWGNYVHVTTGDADDAEQWIATFRAAFPDAGHVAVGLPRMPDAARYAAHGLELDVDDALACDRLPDARPLPDGYAVRVLTSDSDWEAVRLQQWRENERSGEYDPVDHDRFVRAQIATRRRSVAAGDAAWFGAFAGSGLAADLGIHVLGRDARYASVETVEAHRRRGLAGHLLGVAARWAGERGAQRFVIVTGATNPAGRLYRSVGFEPVPGGVGAYRRPPR